MNGRRMLQWGVIVSVVLLTLPTALHLIAQDVVPNELELVGVIESIDGDTVTVNGQVFDIANAELKGELTVGEVIKIHASLSDTDAWVAREVETAAEFGDDDDDSNSDDDANTDDDDDSDSDASGDDATNRSEFSITGILEEVGEDYIVVSGLRIDTTGAEMESPLVIGEMVEIHKELVDGNLVVHEVEMEDDANTDDDDTSGKPDDWIPYIVQPGDTLDDLAAIIGTSPEELAAANGIDATQDLVVGSILYGPAHDSNDDSDDDSNDDSDDDSNDDSDDDSDDGSDDDSNDDSNDDSDDDSNDDSSDDSNDGSDDDDEASR